MTNFIDKYGEQLFIHQEGIFSSLDGKTLYLRQPDPKAPHYSKPVKFDTQDLLKPLSAMDPEQRTAIWKETLATHDRDVLRKIIGIYASRKSSYSFSPDQTRASAMATIKAISDNAELSKKASDALSIKLKEMGADIEQDWDISKLNRTAGIDIYMWHVINDTLLEVIKDTEPYPQIDYDKIESHVDTLHSKIFEKAEQRFPKIFAEINSDERETIIRKGLVSAQYYGFLNTGGFNPDIHPNYDVYIEELTLAGIATIDGHINRTLDLVREVSSQAKYSDERKTASDLLEASINDNLESQYTLEKGMYVLISVNPETILGDDGIFYPKDKNIPSSTKLVGGLAENALNRIKIEAMDFQRSFREEVTHMSDYWVARDAELRGNVSLHYSHMLITDDVTHGSDKGSDLTRLQNYWGNGTWKNPYLDENPILAGVYEVVRELGTDPFQRKQLSYSQKGTAEYLAKEIEDILTLPYTVYDDIRDTKDGDFHNQDRDTEVMAKFHVLRMQLEDWYSENYCVKPDHYGTDANSPILRMLEATAPKLTQVYRTGWLPAINIAIQIEEPQTRAMLLKAHMGTLDEQHALITKQERAELENLASQNPSLSVVFNENEGENDTLKVEHNGRLLSLPITLTQ